MNSGSIVAALLLGAAAAAPSTAWAEVEFSGQIRPELMVMQRPGRGPLALADAIEPGLVASGSGLVVQTELHAGYEGWHAIATLQQQRLQGSGWQDQGWFNEAYWSGGGAGAGSGWQWSAGKKIVGWDVGYGFRPDDMVEQEQRRTLLAVTPIGRPVLMAEHFDASTAWSFVLANVTHSRDERGADEPAFAARWYRRIGGLDAYGFLRHGAHTGQSVGAAAAWVANESLELHGSWRWSAAADSLALAAGTTGPVNANPWQPATVPSAVQGLVGGTWTNAEQFSLLAEAWWDGTALSDPQWTVWSARNQQLTGTLARQVPPAAVAGNLAWQGNAFNAASNLRRANLYLRASWTWDHWQPALDTLYNPADGGRSITASLGWQGDRWRFDAAARWYGGPSGAVAAQLPTRRQFVGAATWAF